MWLNSPVVTERATLKMADQRPHKRSHHIIRTVKGINPTLWRWAKARVALENRSVGELINELIDKCRQDVEGSNVALKLTSPYEADKSRARSIRGIDGQLWRWLRAKSIMEDHYLSEVLNELLYRHMITAEEPQRVIRTVYRECVNCGRWYETEREDSSACSNKCRVALHRRRTREEKPNGNG